MAVGKDMRQAISSRQSAPAPPGHSMGADARQLDPRLHLGLQCAAQRSHPSFEDAPVLPEVAACGAAECLRARSCWWRRKSAAAAMQGGRTA